MLFVTRRHGEAIVIKLQTRGLSQLMILSVKGSQVRLGNVVSQRLRVLGKALGEFLTAEHEKPPLRVFIRRRWLQD